MNSIYAKRPLREIASQLGDTIPQFSYDSDFLQKISFQCAVETLSQYQRCLESNDKEHISEEKLPSILPCEKKVMSQDLFTSTEISRMFKQLSWLIDEAELGRAKDVINRWLNKLTPFELISIMAKNEDDTAENFPLVRNTESLLQKNDISQFDFSDITEQWGNISYHLKLPYFSCNGDEQEQSATKYFNKGWLKCAQNDYSSDFFEKWEINRTHFFNADIEEMFVFILKNASNEDILSYIANINISQFSYLTKVCWVYWAINHDEGERCIPELEEILAHGIEPLGKHQLLNEHKTNFMCAVMIAFIQRLYGYIKEEDIETFASILLKRTCDHEVKKTDGVYLFSEDIILSGFYLSDIFSSLNSPDKFEDYNEKVDYIFELVFKSVYNTTALSIDIDETRCFLLDSVLSFSDRYSGQFKIKVHSLIADYANDANSLVAIEIWWPYLKRQGEGNLLFEIFEQWLSLKSDDLGKAWKLDLDERTSIADILLPLAKGMGWEKEIQEVQSILECYKVEYLFRKDHSLFRPFEWFNSIEKINLTWQGQGIDLLNISEYASRTGSNLASEKIEEAVAALAGSRGSKGVYAFIKTIRPNSLRGFQMILNAIIESFNNCIFTESDILLIWKMTVDLLYIDTSPPRYHPNNLTKIDYLIDLRKAIIHYLSNHPENNRISIERQIKEYSLFEYQVEKEDTSYYTPDRWFDEKPINTKAEECFKKYWGII